VIEEEEEEEEEEEKKKKKKKDEEEEEEEEDGELGEESRQVKRSELTFLRDSIAFWKPPRLRPIVLLVRATCRRR